MEYFNLILIVVSYGLLVMLGNKLDKKQDKRKPKLKL